MSDAFAELIDRSVVFFTELSANNTKAFFEPKKEFYRDEIKKPAELLAEILGERIGRATGRSYKPKLFRIHRDVRFSKDKTPYNTHLHLMWSTSGDAAPAWFYGVSPSYHVVGMGLMGLKGDHLTRFRTLVDREGDALVTGIERSGAQLSDWGPEPLKRVPSPYPQDHPQAAFLKRKALAINAEPADNWRAELVPAAMNRVNAMLPVWRILDAEFGG